MQFDANRYEASHGKAPRGRGGWGFTTPANWARPTMYADEVFWAPVAMTFTEAKRAARKHFPAGSVVVVMP